MLEIPGIDPDKVERYGKRFLKLVKTAHDGYESIMQPQEDRPRDPNHEPVIIISEDEFADDGGFDELAGPNGSQEERSTYFQPAPEVDAFNARCE